ncbi:4Fe-4S dicluster domain-containing protein [Desulfitobacterium chlororespirans]|uniref:Tetrathionate reductase subunit B n=1 Tax=Desulfitobacterium chlororespirans DSM 11544 TaxID=1121395 RepID=A0A1M7S150_9FIRM|nr:4Fe-4S dicluster domain-containing protein [Desulfitobacterium chlororespirans]SHN52208.1 tetrathionate reductase subunit B [Desulfitobacterium chlororespirans DSM 11544]
MSANLEPRYGMVIDLRRCVGCHSCTVSCKMENNVPEGAYRSWVVEGDKGIYPNVTRVKLPRLCNQCQDAPCQTVCPVKATHKDEGGVIVVDPDKCIGCRYCIAACPYDARFLNKETGMAEKCDLCIGRIKAGLMPACISNCIAHARIFGDLNHPDSEINRLLAEHPAQALRSDLGTRPSVFYIGLDEAFDSISLNDLERRK